MRRERDPGHFRFVLHTQYYCIQCGYQPLAVTGRRADDLSILRGPVAQYAFSGPALSPAPAALLTTGASANTRHTSAHRLRTAFIILAAP